MGRMGDIRAPALSGRRARQTYKGNREDAQNISASDMVQPLR